MKIAIWTQAPPKVEAIKDAIKKCYYFDSEEIEIINNKVESWISEMPISTQEIMIWAKNRAVNIKNKIEADFYIWMEWGTSYMLDKTYLFWVVFIIDNKWNKHYWISNFIELPKVFHEKIYLEKLELWPVLANISGVENASKKNWAFWAWTNNIITRKDQFEIAFLSAIAPFFNEYYKL